MFIFPPLSSRFASISLLSMAMLSFAIASPSYASTIYVPDDHRTIQSAIDAAAEGDTIVVKPGTYPGALRIEKHITLRTSSVVTSDTVIDATGDTTAITINVDNSPATVTVQGFTIRNNTPVALSPALVPSGGIIATAASLDLFENDFRGSTGDTSLRLSISTTLHLIENNFNTDVTGVAGHCPTLHPQLTILGSTASTYLSINRNKFTGGGTTCQNKGIDLIRGSYSILANRFTKIDSPLYIGRASGVFLGNVVEKFTGQVNFWTDSASNLVQGTVGSPTVFIVNNSFDQATNPLNTLSPYSFQGALAKFSIVNNVFSASSARALIECTDDTHAPAKTPVIWFHNLLFNRDTGLLAVGSCSFLRSGEEGNLTQDPRYVGTGADPLAPSAGSPLIDAGTNSPQIAGTGGDILDQPRVTNAGIGLNYALMDIGAYEYPGLTGGKAYTWLLLNASDYIAPVGSTVNLNANFQGVTSGDVTVDQDGIGTLATQFTTTTPVAFASKSLHAGVNVFHASYAGDAAHSPTSTPPVYIYGSTSTATDTTTTLTVTPNPVFVQQAVTLSAHIAPISGLAITGTVSFMDGATVIGTATVDASSNAVFSTSSLGIGTHALTAVYSGDSNFNASTSAARSLMVKGYPTALTVNVPATAFAYEPKAITAHVSSSSTPAQPSTGTVIFTSGTISLGSAPINSSGDATLSFAQPVGDYTITAAFAANGIYLASAGTGPAIHVIADTTATTLTGIPNTQIQGRNVQFTVTTSALHSSVAAQGSFALMEGTTVIATSSLEVTGRTTFNINSLAPGTHTLTAMYTPGGTGAINFLGSSSNDVTVTITPSDFALTAPPTVSLQAEHHATITVEANSIGDFASPVQISCGNLPAHARCYFNHGDTVNLSGGGKASLDIWFETSDVLGYRSSVVAGIPTTLRLALFVFPCALFGIRKRHIIRGLIIAVFAITAAASLSGCSGMYPGYTPPGTYTIELAGSGGGITHSATTTVTVTR